MREDLSAQETNRRATDGPERGGVDESVLPEPGVPHEGERGRQGRVDHKRGDAPRAPGAQRLPA
jgi:hypothetical protein